MFETATKCIDPPADFEKYVFSRIYIVSPAAFLKNKRKPLGNADIIEQVSLNMFESTEKCIDPPADFGNCVFHLFVLIPGL